MCPDSNSQTENKFVKSETIWSDAFCKVQITEVSKFRRSYGIEKENC